MSVKENDLFIRKMTQVLVVNMLRHKCLNILNYDLTERLS